MKHVLSSVASEKHWDSEEELCLAFRLPSQVHSRWPGEECLLSAPSVVVQTTPTETKTNSRLEKNWDGDETETIFQNK